MPETEAIKLATKLQQLAAEVRVLRWISGLSIPALLIALGSLALLTYSSAKKGSSPTEIRAAAFVLMGTDGSELARLGESSGEPNLAMFKDGQTLVEITTLAGPRLALKSPGSGPHGAFAVRGGECELTLADDRAVPRVRLGTGGGKLFDGPSMAFTGKNGEPRLVMGTTATLGSAVVLLDAAGSEQASLNNLLFESSLRLGGKSDKCQLLLRSSKDAAELMLKDTSVPSAIISSIEKGSPTVMLTGDSGGISMGEDLDDISFRLHDATGKIRTSLELGDGSPSLQLIGSDGGARVSMLAQQDGGVLALKDANGTSGSLLTIFRSDGRPRWKAP